MRARRTGHGAFLERTDAAWRALGVPERNYSRYAILPALGWHKLARSGALRPDEVTRLRRIAAGAETHPRVDMGRALLLLRDHEGKARCGVHERCAHGWNGCDCNDGETV